MADYELQYFMKDGGKRSGPHTIEMSTLPNLSAAQTEARDNLVDIELQNPRCIKITSAKVRRMPNGRRHKV